MDARLDGVILAIPLFSWPSDKTIKVASPDQPVHLIPELDGFLCVMAMISMI